MRKAETKKMYDTEINRNCPDCILHWNIYYRCEKHLEEYIEFWETKRK